MRFAFRAWHAGNDNSPGRMAHRREQGYEGNCFAWAAEGQRVTIMQWTGLPDKHGTMVYEGDIINTSQGLGVVFWSQIECQFKVSFGEDRQDQPLWHKLKELAVTGNIYENPEKIPFPHSAWRTG